ncbi:MAG: DUF1801 domain-containing protein [Pirellulaceae bacterium]
MTKVNTKNAETEVTKFLAGVKDEQKRADCLAVLELMKELTGEPAAMWGKDKVGFGRFHYRGKTCEGYWFHVGFAPRKQDLTLYLNCGLQMQTDLLEKLGKHKTGKSCLYVKRFDDLHLPTLKNLIKMSYKSPAIEGATID